jgi:histidinol-phosphatase (PHP family)
MPFSHHSHSGEFCPSHAQNTLEQVIQTAIEQGMEVFCLSEHMPRSQNELYEEVSFIDNDACKWSFLTIVFLC